MAELNTSSTHAVFVIPYKDIPNC